MKNMEDMGKEEIIELFSQHDFIVKDIDIVYEEILANVYIVVGDIELYRIDTIEKIVKKLKNMKDELTKEELIKDIIFGDLYQGDWRILVYFKGEE